MKNSLPPTPKGLSPAARKLWREICSDWLLDRPALLVLKAGLEAHDRMLEAQLILAVDGPIILDRFHQKKMHPAALVERDSRAAMLAALRALKLDLEPPRDRLGRPPANK